MKTLLGSLIGPSVLYIFCVGSAFSSEDQGLETFDFRCTPMAGEYSYGPTIPVVHFERVAYPNGLTFSVAASELGLYQTIAYSPHAGRETFTVSDKREGLWGYFDAGENSMIRAAERWPDQPDMAGRILGISPGNYGTEFEFSRYTNQLEVIRYQKNVSEGGPEYSNVLRYKHTFKCEISSPLW